MRTAISTIAAIFLGAAAVAGAPIAAADDFSGEYAYRPGVGPMAGDFSALWTVTPCGDGCRHIVTSTGATDAEAHLEGSYWVFDKFVDPAVECPGNSYTIVSRKVSATVHFKINPDSLIGQFQPLGTPCGGTTVPSGFSLTKTVDGNSPPVSGGLSSLPAAGGGGGGAHGGGH